MLESRGLFLSDWRGSPAASRVFTEAISAGGSPGAPRAFGPRHVQLPSDVPRPSAGAPAPRRPPSAATPAPKAPDSQPALGLPALSSASKCPRHHAGALFRGVPPLQLKFSLSASSRMEGRFFARFQRPPRRGCAGMAFGGRSAPRPPGAEAADAQRFLTSPFLLPFIPGPWRPPSLSAEKT